VQRLAGERQRDAARVALEELGADGVLEVGDALAGGTDRQVCQLGAAADAAGAHDQAEQRQRDEVEAVQVHGRPMLSARPLRIPALSLVAAERMAAGGPR
jgi:hypothetical protein